MCAFPSIYPSGLSDHHFSNKESQKIFRELENFRHCDSIDEFSLCVAAEVPNKYAIELQEIVVKSVTQATEYCRLLSEHVDFHQMLKDIGQIAKDAKKHKHPIDFFASKCEHTFSQIRIDGQHEPKSFKELIKEGLQNQKQLLKNNISPSYTTGIKSLDGRTGGFREDELIVLAAEAGAGKSTLALWFARHIAAEHGNVLFFSAEMTNYQMSERGAKAELGVPLVGGKVTVEEIEDLLGVIDSNEIVDRIQFDFRPRYGMADVLSLGRHANRNGELKLIIFDHLRKWEPSRKSSNDVDRISNAIEEAKEAAKILGVPILMLTHLSRSRAGADRPDVTMIRGSGKIEDEADHIWMLWPRRHPDGSRSQETEIWIEKSRQGGNLGPVSVIFDPTTQGFIEPF